MGKVKYTLTAVVPVAIASLVQYVLLYVYGKTNRYNWSKVQSINSDKTLANFDYQLFEMGVQV